MQIFAKIKDGFFTSLKSVLAQGTSVDVANLLHSIYFWRNVRTAYVKRTCRSLSGGGGGEEEDTHVKWFGIFVAIFEFELSPKWRPIWAWLQL